jgi:cation:H+ antiporter
MPGRKHPYSGSTTARVVAIFVAGAVVTLAAGMALQITLFLLADLLAGTPVIVAAHHSDACLGGLALLLTGIAAAAIIARPRRTFRRLGIDSIAMLVIYTAGIAFLTQAVK